MMTDLVIIGIMIVVMVGTYLVGESTGWWRRGKYEQMRRDSYSPNIHQAQMEIDVLRKEKEIMRSAQNEANKRMEQLHKMLVGSVENINAETNSSDTGKMMRAKYVHRKFFNACSNMHKSLEKIYQRLS